MREIKLRAWIPDEDLLLVIPCTDGDHISELTDDGIRIVRYNDYIVKESGGNIIETEGYEPCEAHIMQFTGLHDNTKWEQLSSGEQDEWLKIHAKKEWKGREIYEGDLLTHSDKDIHVVEYNCGRWSARLIKHVSKSRWPAQYLDCTYMGWEVIGNIYQDKHLLEK